MKNCERCGTEINNPRCKYCPSCKSEIHKESTKRSWQNRKAEGWSRSVAPTLNEKEKRIQRRNTCLYHYSEGSMKCRRCGFDDVRALSMDHIHNNGYEHRKTVAGGQLCRWLITNGFPDGFQVLCMNCQFIKAAEKRERDAKYS